MKREFKAGDRVLVRNHDLADWEYGILLQQHNNRSHPFSVCLEKNGRTFNWSQCRHIDGFRTGDKVQVSRDGIEWQDAEYVGYIESSDNDYVHAVTNELYNLVQFKFCRWHPSMPWAEKEELLTLEQRVEALERKLNELCG